MYFFAQLINLCICCCMLLVVILVIGVIARSLLQQNSIGSNDKKKGSIPSSKSKVSKPEFEEAEYREVK